MHGHMYICMHVCAQLPWAYYCFANLLLKVQREKCVEANSSSQAVQMKKQGAPICFFGTSVPYSCKYSVIKLLD